MEYIAHNVKETRKIAEMVIKNILNKEKTNKAVIIALYGDLGSGKTNFAQAVARELGISETVPSPTFVIERIYEIKKSQFTHFVHIDAYRMDKSDELKQIGWDEIIEDRRNIILVEWADKIENVLPKHSIKIHFEHMDEQKRKITVNEK